MKSNTTKKLNIFIQAIYEIFWTEEKNNVEIFIENLYFNPTKIQNILKIYKDLSNYKFKDLSEINKIALKWMS